MSLKIHLNEIQIAIRGGQFPNEAAVSRGVVMRLLQALGWPVFETNIVWPEYPLETLFVDYALCHPIRRPAVIIEVKAVGKLGGADNKLFEYAFRAGVPMAILTDGQEWHFYLPSGQGSITERRFYKLDILERDLEEASARLSKYLAYDRIRNGEATKAARADHDSTAIRRTINDNLPIAWRKLIEEQDSLLIDLISEKVADLCGYQPEPDMVADFLVGQLRTSIQPFQQANVPPTPFVPPIQPTKRITPVNSNRSIGYTLNGVTTSARSAAEVLVKVLDELSAQDPNFLTRFASRKHGRRRRYVAQNREDLYPERPDLMELSKQLSTGWWVGTNYSKSNIHDILKLTCEVAGLNYGQNFVVNLGNGSPV